jgi:hypothetical protein
MGKCLGTYSRGHRETYYEPSEPHEQYVVYTCDKCGEEVEILYQADFYFNDLSEQVDSDSLLSGEGWSYNEESDEYICGTCGAVECAGCGATIPLGGERCACEDCGAPICEDCSWEHSLCASCR